MAKHSKDVKLDKRKLIIKLLEIIFILSIVLLLMIKITQYVDDKKQGKILQELQDINIDRSQVTSKITEKMLKVIELQKDNSEVIGWITIDGTKIDYPVCQTSNNDYYLNHTYEKEKNSNGSIFLDKDYDFSIPSENLLIYRS